MSRMQRLMFAGALGCALLLAAARALADVPAGYTFLRYDDGLRQAQLTGKRVFLYFGRKGCAWCEIVNKNAFTNVELKKTYLAHYVMVYADSEGGQRLQLPNGERITEAELGVRFKAFATPLFIYLEPDGTPIFQAPGVQTVEDFMKYDRFVHGGLYKTQDAKKFLADNP